MTKRNSIEGIGKTGAIRDICRKNMLLCGGAILMMSIGLVMVAWGQPGGAGGQGAIPGAPSGVPGGQGEMQGAPGGMPAGISPGGNMGPNASVNYTPAIYINDGAYLKEKSHPEAVSSGKVENSSASGIKMSSNEKEFNGIYVAGSKSDYTLSDAVFELSGNGINHMDNYGSGAGAVAGGGATLTLKNVKITTNGLVSCAAVSTGGSTLKVYDSTLIANGGILPPGSPAPGTSPEAYGPPAALGITSGNARTCNTTNNAKSYYYNSTIIADGWGALSTDESGSQGVYLEANNCDVKVIKSGYGTYADGGCEVVINGSRLNVATYGGIAAGSGKIHFNDTDVVSGKNCVMLHNIGSASEITTFGIKGGRIETKEAVVLVKSANADITIEGAGLVSKKGILIQSIINDDANASKVNGQKVPGIKATLSKMTLEGDILHEDNERAMTLSLNETSLKGAVKNASLVLDSKSKWTATADSSVTLIGAIDVKCIDAQSGVTITAAAGNGCTLKGEYKLASGGILNVTI